MIAVTPERMSLPSISVTCPARMPGTSVYAFSGPGENCPGTIPNARARTGVCFNISPWDVINGNVHPCNHPIYWMRFKRFGDSHHGNRTQPFPATHPHRQLE